MKHVIQPEGSSICGHCCVAMAAGVSLTRAIDLIGHERGTKTSEIVIALRLLGVPCDSKLKRVCRKRPHLPKRAVVAIHRPYVEGKHRGRWHWMLTWDGTIYDPGNSWPDSYRDWKITSALEIHS